MAGYKLLLLRKLDIILEPSLIARFGDLETGESERQVQPVIRLYLQNFCLGTYFHNTEKNAFFFEYRYPRFYLGGYFELPKESPYYPKDVIVEITAGINFSKTGQDSPVTVTGKMHPNFFVMMKLFITALMIVTFLAGIMAQNPAGEKKAGDSVSRAIPPEASGDQVRVDSFNLRLIPPSSGVSFYGNDLVFLSLSKDERRMSSSHLAFGTLQAYIAPVEDTVTGPHHEFSPFSSTVFSFPCDGLTFTPDGKTMYFTRLSKNDGKEKIYEADRYSTGKRVGWSWANAPLSFCKDTFRYSHPALSKDGGLLVFASDKAGPARGMDLYISRKKGNDWTSPVNAGTTVNTRGNEMFPFLDRDNNLYFSSDGFKGLGGYDIYVSRYNGEGWDQPENLGAKINTAGDDIAFTLDPRADTLGFYTVRQPMGRKSMQLYKVTTGSREPSALSAALIGAAEPAVPSATGLCCQCRCC